MKFYIIILFTVICGLQLMSQNQVNGILDDISELSTRKTIQIPMKDGTLLETDIYLPISSDSLVVEMNMLGQKIRVPLYNIGTQLVRYPWLINSAGDTIQNPNPFELPLVFTRTPYGKEGEGTGPLFNLLGYNYALQDMRGRYNSQGLYLPMFSDGWDKSKYHPSISHVLDVVPASDSRSANHHEDGWESYRYLLTNATRDYDINEDGVIDHSGPICNGSMGMFGASALGNTQYQLASAHKINSDGPGLKCLLPIVATNEHYLSTGFNNGVFREGLVYGWVSGQLKDLNTDLPSIQADSSIFNTIHTPRDYNLPDLSTVINKGVDHFTSIKYNQQITSAYPNSINRCDMDASFAPVDAQGEADPTGSFSRYSNLNVPIYNITGWWDIFVNGQMLTREYTKANCDSKSKPYQKIIIGPWAHQTIGSTTTGDAIYPNNVTGILGLDFKEVNFNKIDLSGIAKSEALAWYRSTLNYNDYKKIAEPIYRIPEAKQFISVGSIGVARIPIQAVDLSLEELLNFLGGKSGIKNVKIEFKLAGQTNFQIINYDIPPLQQPILPFEGSALTKAVAKDFSKSKDYKFYVVGPTQESENNNVGNYWFESDEFPPMQSITYEKLFITEKGKLSEQSPKQTFNQTYSHIPDNPAFGLGGNNMLERTPDDFRNSQGQINLASPALRAYELDHPGVIQFTTGVFLDTFCFIGAPRASLYASSMPQSAVVGEPTSTDFFVRLIDVCPDGRELFICEGAVNARAKEYARHIYLHHQEDINIPFSNIEAGKIEKFEFELLPIAYTMGRGHQLKILIQSAVWPKYQSNPNLPLEDGDFFRRRLFDATSYRFQGKEMTARTANNTIYSSPSLPSFIELPVYNSKLVLAVEDNKQKNPIQEIAVYPNPTSDWLHITDHSYQSTFVELINTDGKTISAQKISGNLSLDVRSLASGTYIVHCYNSSGAVILNQRVIISH